MTGTNHRALAIAQTYVNGIANKNVDAIIAISDDGVVCTSPIGRITGAHKFREFHDGFARMLKRVMLLAAYGDDEQAVVGYKAENEPAASAVTAELIKVKDGKIVSTDVIYDATPFAAYMATVKPH